MGKDSFNTEVKILHVSTIYRGMANDEWYYMSQPLIEVWRMTSGEALMPDWQQHFTIPKRHAKKHRVETVK